MTFILIIIIIDFQCRKTNWEVLKGEQEMSLQ